MEPRGGSPAARWSSAVLGEEVVQTRRAGRELSAPIPGERLPRRAEPRSRICRCVAEELPAPLAPGSEVALELCLRNSRGKWVFWKRGVWFGF